MIQRVYDFDDEGDRLYVLSLLKAQAETSGTDLISYYLRDYNDSRLSKLRAQKAQAKSIKSKQTQRKVLAGLDTLIEVLSELQDDGYSYALFVKDKFKCVLKIPRSIAKNSYFCGKTFDLQKLQSHTQLCWGILVLDTQQVTIGVLKNNHIQVLQNYSAYIPGKMRAGGQSQPRFEQTRKNLVYHHIECIAEKCNALFEPKKISKLLLGGIIPTVELFYNMNCLRPDLKEVLEPPVTTVYTNKKGLEQILEKKRQLYNNELRDYFLERQMYQKALTQRSQLVTENQIKLLENYIPVQVYTVDMAINAKSYCSTCGQIKSTRVCDICEEVLEPVTSICKINNFKSNTEWGQKFLRKYGSLYRIKSI